MSKRWERATPRKTLLFQSARSDPPQTLSCIIYLLRKPISKVKMVHLRQFLDHSTHSLWTYSLFHLLTETRYSCLVHCVWKWKVCMYICIINLLVFRQIHVFIVVLPQICLSAKSSGLLCENIPQPKDPVIGKWLSTPIKSLPPWAGT